MPIPSEKKTFYDCCGIKVTAWDRVVEFEGELGLPPVGQLNPSKAFNLAIAIEEAAKYAIRGE
jgi:hypothetical protein